MTVVVHLLLVCTVVYVSQGVPCDSFLRPYYPEYFTHCCVYSEWSEWTYIGGGALDQSCSTGQSFSEARSRHLIGLPWGCDDLQSETRRKCVSKAELLIRLLGLGAVGTQNLQRTSRTTRSSATSSPPPRCPPITGEHGYLCFDLYRSIGRRSAAMKEESLGNLKAGIEQNQEVAIKDSSLLPFVWNNDHTLFRRQNNQRACRDDDMRYILFLLDTSDSVGSYNFSRITAAIGNISTLFCRQIQIAVMTFSHHYRLEFCFNCYDNDPTGRSSLSQAIKNIQYREGQSYAAGAARCACMDLLQESCGLPQDAECLDIVFVTDGHSTDPFLNLCEEVQCLHNRGLNTYALGIGSFNENNIHCIQNSTELSLLFQFTDLDELEAVFEDAIALLQLSNGIYSCIDSRGFLNQKK